MKFYLEDGLYIDSSSPLDLSIPLLSTGYNLTAWNLQPPRIEPINSQAFIGCVAQGGSVNFRNIDFNPHGHITHTECLGHITEPIYSINKSINEFFFHCRVISIRPETIYNAQYGVNDSVICKIQVEAALKGVNELDALIIRTLPNNRSDKFQRSFSNTNPAYIEPEVVTLLDQLNVKHLLVDLPSVDRENDNGKLAFHHRFWKIPENPDHTRTITEFIYVDNSIEDGKYILELQIAPFENDASPSRPLLYRILSDP
jgi:arylformamidase